jgi:hypothetical protein
LKYRNKIAIRKHKSKPESRRPFFIDAAVAAADEHEIGATDKQAGFGDPNDALKFWLEKY